MLPSLKYGLALDLPGGLWGKTTTGRQLIKACEDLRRRGFHVEHLFGDSREVETQVKVLNAGPFDAILIDGDHTYAGVQADWENYRALAPIVAFHDIVGHDQRERVSNRAVEVPRLWAEIKESGLRCVEFTAPGSAMGIGVVFR
jgi:tRNA G37 N-methylase Trm5